MDVSAFLTNDVEVNAERCLLCNNTLLMNDKKQIITEKGWDKLVNDAQKWSTLKIDDIHDQFYEFQNAYSRIFGKSVFGEVYNYFICLYYSRLSITRTRTGNKKSFE